MLADLDHNDISIARANEPLPEIDHDLLLQAVKALETHEP
jgi:hypothetical protein